ncbi:phage antirepressor N-terminal domain-containing protein [Rodentibacter pneumotropicus]|uniref:phage antirepressor N-terminal domain-containing protein n=1 Tax=Rodentibacter pneumotropicus TaxID=758 RepID=UPI001F3E5BC6|nr:phage antirepressor N-terminal domain-containing protein [Rodentibacter pneumotropicus]
MSNQISTQTISFYGSDLITLKVEDVIYTAVRPLVEAIGLDWAGQTVKLNKNKDKFNCCDISTVGADGKIRKMLCMPLKKLNGWLFSINPEKVRSDLKEKVIRYQEECFEALYNYWHFGKAERKTTTDERTGLRNAVNMLVSKKGLIYSEAYNLVHQYMNVESIEDIPADKLQTAVEYVHKIALEGELIIDVPLPQEKPEIAPISNMEIHEFINYWFATTRFHESVYFLMRKLASFRSRELDSVNFNYDVCQKYLRMTQPIVDRLIKQRNNPNTLIDNNL